MRKSFSHTAEINLKMLDFNRLDLIIGMPVQNKIVEFSGGENHYKFLISKK